MIRLLVVDQRPAGRRELLDLAAAEGLAEPEAAADLAGALACLRAGRELGRPFALAYLCLPPLAPAGAWSEALRSLWSAEPELEIVAAPAPGEELGELAPGALGAPHRLLVLRQGGPGGCDAPAVRQALRALAEKSRLARGERASAALQSSYVELERAHAAAQAATRAKTEFLANMSHEIRTPMTAILGYADLLRDPELSRGEHHTYLNVIRRNGDHLLALINDILDLSKVEAGRMTIEQVACSPEAILNEVAALMRVRARLKHLAFEVACEGPLPETIVSDPTRLRQILLNLVGNAIKFTARGGVHVTCRMQAGGDRPRLAFEVRDSGIGLTLEERRVLFQPFSQGDSSTTRRFGGTGLGLVISKRLAQMLGGDIEVESELGAGSVFTLWLASAAPAPAEPGASPTPRKPDPLSLTAVRLPPGRVLLAEDGRDNQILITRYLERAGLEVSLADDGAAALERALASEPPFDLILMDMQMPELDGYEVTRALRRAGRGGPIVALTAHAMPGDRERCLDAGCDEYLTKPVDRARLLETCARFLLARPPFPRPALPSPSPAGEAAERVRGGAAGGPPG